MPLGLGLYLPWPFAYSLASLDAITRLAIRYLLPTTRDILNEHNEHTAIPSHIDHSFVVWAWATYNFDDLLRWNCYGQSLSVAGLDCQSIPTVHPVHRHRVLDARYQLARQGDHVVLDDATRQGLAVMTTDFRKLWDDPSTPNRERKRLLAYIIEDATLSKVPAEGITKIHVRFKGGKTETLTTRNPKSSAQQIKTRPEIVELVDQLLDHHVYSEIATIFNERGFRPGGSARPGRRANRFSAKHVAYLMHTYGLCTRYDRLRQRGMLNKKEMADRIGVHEQTVERWAKNGIIRGHLYNDHGWQLYELLPGPNMPV
jgi:hypothetical protein